ncbi:hypothetical protein EI94DRAFT_1287424 [Lactarius quietus]|nr:hypothetical protein EI94DRAFT_1287424 [Lactarius quietus]
MTMRSYATPADPSIHSAPPERSRLSTCASNSQFLSKKMSNTAAPVWHSERSRLICAHFVTRTGAPIAPCAHRARFSSRHVPAQPAHCKRPRCPRGYISTPTRPVTSHKDDNNSDAGVGTGAERSATKVTEKEVRRSSPLSRSWSPTLACSHSSLTSPFPNPRIRVHSRLRLCSPSLARLHHLSRTTRTLPLLIPLCLRRPPLTDPGRAARGNNRLIPVGDVILAA